MFGNQMLYGTFIVVLMAVFHVVCLLTLSRLISRVASAPASLSSLRAITLLSIAVIGITAIHTVEALGWAAIFVWVGEFSDIGQSLYFSFATSTTLGYGDVTLSPQWQLLGTFEALGGLILFGTSTAFLLELMQRVFRDRLEPR